MDERVSGPDARSTDRKDRTALLELTADPDRERADRAFAAMLRMTKIDIAELYRAADRT